MAIEMVEVASGLRFPEGPVAMADGSVLLVEIAAGRVSRVQPDGRVEIVAEPGGGPNGLALGPDGALYVCNNGGFEWHDFGGILVPGEQPADYSGGRIERIDPRTGRVDVLYRECGGHPLRGPNDIVFDAAGGFWFTDHGKIRKRERDRGGIYYATPDGRSIREMVYPLDSPNGVGLSPDGGCLYAAETFTGRVWAWTLDGPGKPAPAPPAPGGNGGTLIAGLGGFQLLDSLAIEGDGSIAVATLVNGGITVISPDGSAIEHVPTPDPLTTNICFGGPDLRTAWITASGSGKLYRCKWPRPGLKLAY